MASRGSIHGTGFWAHVLVITFRLPESASSRRPSAVVASRADDPATSTQSHTRDDKEELACLEATLHAGLKSSTDIDDFQKGCIWMLPIVRNGMRSVADWPL
eukprot:scaffold162549_cov34-Prasinocladus_malaysianus.AAC.1